MNFGEMPIVRNVNPFTRLLEGNDKNYRKIPLSEYDDVDPDPLMETSLRSVSINYLGKTPGIMEVYDGGIPHAPKKNVVRLPFERQLQRAHARVSLYGFDLTVIDGFRDVKTQASFFAEDCRMVADMFGYQGKRSICQVVKAGLKANQNTAYADVVKDDRYEEILGNLLIQKDEEVNEAVVTLLEDDAPLNPHRVAELFLTFMANCGQNDLALDEVATTAHGNGGAADVWMWDRQKNRYANFGAPYSYVVLPGTRISPAVINYFELVSPEEYTEQVARDPALQWYLAYHGVQNPANMSKTVAMRIYEEARRNRRIMNHALDAEGTTYFSLDEILGEFWHRNGGNEDGGKQANISDLAGSGNGCHAVLKGKPKAAWTNAVGHRLARSMGIIPARTA